MCAGLLKLAESLPLLPEKSLDPFNIWGNDLPAVPTGGGRFRYQAHSLTMQKMHPHRQQALLRLRVICDTKAELQSQGCKL